MRICHITELPYNIGNGTVFSHVCKNSGLFYKYRITSITERQEKYSDNITVELIESDNADALRSFEVEPQWFLERRIKFHQ